MNMNPHEPTEHERAAALAEFFQALGSHDTLLKARPKPTVLDLEAAAVCLRRSEAGQAALAHAHALLDGPLLDGSNQRHILTLLIGAWTGLYGTALDESGTTI